MVTTSWLRSLAPSRGPTFRESGPAPGALHVTTELRALLDRNDQALRTLGRDLAVVPSVVVVGAQSHGKSSVLEMLAGVKLPAGNGMVTKRPLEVQLRKGGAQARSLSFTPRHGDETVTIDAGEVALKIAEETRRSDVEQAALHNATGIVDLAMTLRVESPELTDVTLIDTPGIHYDDAESEMRIKRLIRERIRPASAIILVVHHANVDASTNQGFMLAREVDPRGERTVCVLTHIDLVDDPQDLRTRVLAELDDPVKTCIAMCCPAASVRDGMSHEAAVEAERAYFEEHALLGEYRGCTGTEALNRVVGARYLDAVLAAKGPMESRFLQLRAEARAALDALPEPQPSGELFCKQWARLVRTLGDNVRSNTEQLHAVRGLDEACHEARSALLDVPLSMLDPLSDDHHCTRELAAAVCTVGGTMLVNFTPFHPLTEVVGVQARKHFGRAGASVARRLADVLRAAQTQACEKLGARCDSILFADCLALIGRESEALVRASVAAVKARLQQTIEDEALSTWTCNPEAYERHRQALLSAFNAPQTNAAASGELQWAQRVAAQANAFDWQPVMRRGDEKERVVSYFFSFCAYWRMAVESFAEALGKCCLRAVKTLPDKAEHHTPSQGEIERAFERFGEVEERRRRWQMKLEQVEVAHRAWCGGQLPELPDTNAAGSDDDDGVDEQGQP